MSSVAKPLFPTMSAKKGAAFTAAGMGVFFIFCLVVFRWSALDAAAAVLFQLLAVALPGLALTKLLRISLTPLETLCAAYGLGFGVVVGVYFPLATSRRTDLIPFALMAVAVISAAVLVLTRKRPFCTRCDRGELSIGLLASFIASAIACVAFSAGFLDPSLSGVHYYFHDATNAVSLTASAKLGYPFHFLQMAGVTYWYHPFTYAYTASMSLCTGISAFDVTTKLVIFTITPYTICIFTAMAMRISGSKAASAVTAVLSGILPLGGGLFYYFFEDLLGFMPGVAFGGMAALLLMEAQSVSKKINRWHVYSALFMILCTGAKGPVAATIVFGLCFVLLIQLIAEKDLWVIPKGLCYAVPFLLFYYLLYGTAVDESMAVSPLYSAVRTDFAYWLMDFIPRHTLGYNIITGVQYALTMQPAVTVALVVGIIVMVKSRCRDTLANFVTGASLIGLSFINIFKQMGSSEIYFNYCVYWFAAAFLVCQLFKLWQTENRKKTAAILTAIGVLVLGFFTVTQYIPSLTKGLVNTATYSYYNPNKMDTEEEMNAFFRRGASFSPEEYEGYIYMRDNLPDTAVICDYRYEGNNKFFLGCAFSEKMFLLEGWGYVTMEDTNDNTFEKGQRDNYIKSFYNFRDEGFIPILREFGATHIVITEYFTPDWELTAGYTNLIFQNDSIRIYEIII